MASENGARDYCDAWGIIVVFTLAIVYSILYQGHWPVVRDFVNILDKKNWDLFGIYIVILWTLSLAIMPGVLFLMSFLSVRFSGIETSIKKVFLNLTGSLMPVGLMLWIAFVIPMLFANVTFIIQSVSDPFGWGWDFFGTANIPWHQLVPGLIPWMQSGLVITGLYLSLRNLRRSWNEEKLTSRQLFFITVPSAVFITATSVLMIFFFTN